MSDEEFYPGYCQKCAGPIEFPKHATGESTPCPHCGESTLLMPQARPEESQCSQADGETVAGPHCGQDTELYQPEQPRRLPSEKRSLSRINYIRAGSACFCVLVILFIARRGGKDHPEKWRLNQAYDTNGNVRGQESVAAPAKTVIKPRLQVSTTTLFVTNDDTFDWPQADIWLNGIVFGYSFKFGAIKSGETVEIALRDFTKRDGLRFNGFERQPKEVIVHVPGHDSPVMGW